MTKINTLTEYQKEIISKMKDGLYLWTNEGLNWKAWLGDDKGNNIQNVRSDTSSILFNLGYIEIQKSKYDGYGRYKYTLTEKQRGKYDD